MADEGEEDVDPVSASRTEVGGKVLAGVVDTNGTDV